MSESTFGSSLLLVGVAAFALLGAWWLCALANRKVLLLLAVLGVVGAAASIFKVDVNVPLATSHFRPSGELAPWWVALLAWLLRILPLFIPLVASLRRSRSVPTEQAHG